MMTIKKTLEVLNEKCNQSEKGKYLGDAAQYSFFAHTLKLLSKIAKKEIEEKQLPQEAGLQRFDCTKCRGDGYIEEWDAYKGKESKIIRDCPNCKGEGFVMIEVVDKRKKTKENPLYYNDEY